MMKKLIAVVILIAALVGAIVCDSFADSGSFLSTDDTQGPVDLRYIPYEGYVKNGTLYIKGNFCNMTGGYHVTGFENMKIVISEKSGKHIADVKVNDTVQRSCFIGSNNVVAYNFSLKLSGSDDPEYYKLRYEPDGLYAYEACDGRTCTRCNRQNGITVIVTETVDTIKCVACSGDGICSDCDGSRKSKAKGVLGAKGCALCERTGKCYNCNGTGFITY